MHKNKIQPVENVIVDFGKAVIEEKNSDAKPADIMSIPGTAHQKLEALAQLATN